MYFYLARLWRARLGYQRDVALRATLEAGRVAEGLLAFVLVIFWAGLAFAAGVLLTGAALEAFSASFLTVGAFFTATGFLTAAVDLLALLALLGAGVAAGVAAGLALGAGAGSGAGSGAGWASPRASRVDVLSPSGVPAIGLPVRELRRISHSGLPLFW